MEKTIIGKCIDISFEGKGVVKTKDKVIFVDGLFIDEEAEIEIKYRRNAYYFGKIIKLLKISPERIQPKCKVCTACGGCCFQQLSYQAQLKFKSKKVEEQLRKLGKIDFPVNPIIGMDEPYYYRNKIQVPFRTVKGKIVYGFFREGTHEIIPISQCYIEDERASSILKNIRDLMEKFHYKAYDEDQRSGLLRHVLIRTSKYKKEIMVVLVTNGMNFPGSNNFIKELIKKEPQITTIVQNDNHRHTNVILGERERILYGKGYIEDSLCGLMYKISAKSFYQTNPIMTEKLYQFAINSAKLDKDAVVFDAYSGIGTIGLTGAPHCKEVIAAEILREAVADAKQNARVNNISNYKCYCEDATEFILKLAERKTHIDVLFLDPPRKGSTIEFLNAVKTLKPKRVIYISCDPSSLGRDLKELTSAYEILTVQPFDMFPQTAHIETVVSLIDKG